jgi:Rieske 2Fe-2S family protein
MGCRTVKAPGPSPSAGTTDRAPFPDLDEHERVRHKGELDLPQPAAQPVGRARGRIQAHAPGDRSHPRLDCELLFHPTETAKESFDPSDAGDLWDLVNRQDWAVRESVQRGMSSRYFRGGWYAPMEDDSLDIRRWLSSRLPDA